MSGMPVSQESISIYSGGQSQQVSVSATSAQSAVILDSKTMYMCSTVDGFIRQGMNPIAVSTGADQFIPAYTPMRFAGFTTGNKVAFVSTGASGVLYITPEK